MHINTVLCLFEFNINFLAYFFKTYKELEILKYFVQVLTYVYVVRNEKIKKENQNAIEELKWNVKK